MATKPVVWVGSSLRDIRRFPPDARRRAGYEIHQVQLGLEPSDWKPMPSVGSGVKEIRVHTDVEHRVFYVASFAEAVYVLHAFLKKSRKTPRGDIETAKRRLRDVVRARPSSGRQS